MIGPRRPCSKDAIDVQLEWCSVCTPVDHDLVTIAVGKLGGRGSQYALGIVPVAQGRLAPPQRQPTCGLVDRHKPVAVTLVGNG